jgi:hypothetical protein
MSDPCILQWMRSSEAALKEPQIKRGDRPINVSNQSTPWALPPDSELRVEYKLNCLLHDAELPTKMLDHLAELMRADHDAFNSQPALDAMKNAFNFMKKSISSSYLNPASEPSTNKLTTAILDTLLRNVADELDITLDPQPQKQEGKKETHLILDWHVFQGPAPGRVSICWEDKSEDVFNQWADIITDLAKNHKRYPENYWEGPITYSADSIMGKVRFAP